MVHSIKRSSSEAVARKILLAALLCAPFIADPAFAGYVGNCAQAVPGTSAPCGNVDAHNDTGGHAVQDSSSAPHPTQDTNGGAAPTGVNPPSGGSGFLGFLGGIFNGMATHSDAGTIITNTGNAATSAATTATNTGTIATNTGNAATSAATTATNTGNTATNTSNIHSDLGNGGTLHGDNANIQSAPASASTNAVNTQGANYSPTPGTISAQDVATTSTAAQNGSVQITGAPTTSSSVTDSINGMTGVTITVTGSGSNYALAVEESGDSNCASGAYFPVSLRVDGGATGAPRVSSITLVGSFSGPVAHANCLRVRNTSSISGSITVKRSYSSTPGEFKFAGPVNIQDATTSTQLTIKPANTAAANGDTLVPVDAPPDSNLYGALTSSIPAGANDIGIVEGKGTAGSPAGGVMTVQYPSSGGTTVPVSFTSNDPCQTGTKLNADFESTSSGGSIVTAVSGKKIYVCAITIIVSAQANVSIIEGTGSGVCTGGSPSGDYLNPGTTAANGALFGPTVSSPGGVAFGNGGYEIFQTATANQNQCVAFTTTNAPQVNVHETYVLQ
jgi:hypothetical protein